MPWLCAYGAKWMHAKLIALESKRLTVVLDTIASLYQGKRMVIDESQIKQAFDEWVDLLKHTHNEDLLEDPYSVWLEAFHVAHMLSTDTIKLPRG